MPRRTQLSNRYAAGRTGQLQLSWPRKSANALYAAEARIPGIAKIVNVSACRTNGVPSWGRGRCLRSWCVPQNFLVPQRDQPLLMPVDMREWLPVEKRCVRDVGYRVITGGLRPDHATIARFRARHQTALGGLFSQVLRLLAAEGMVALGSLSLDGTKLAGNAAQKANKTLPQIEKILAEAAKADAGDAQQGESPPTTPRALARRAGRRERLAAARDRLVAEDQARRDAQRAKQEAWDAAAAAGRRGGRRPGDEPPRTNHNNTEPRANTTDPDVRVMRNQKGYVAGYNGQLVVTAQQVIVGTMLSQHPVDRTLLHPLLDTCRQQLTEAGIHPKLRTVLADSGYASEESFARADADGLRLLAPLAKDPGRRRIRTPQRARHLDRFPATARARRRLQHPRGREDYRIRARTVEPVFGQLKTCQKMTMMSRRGLTACQSEWLLACAAHNLRKLHRHRTER